MEAYKVIKSDIHRKGLCATHNIKKGKRIIVYRGKKITHKQADEDTKYGYNITYLFTLIFNILCISPLTIFMT